MKKCLTWVLTYLVYFTRGPLVWWPPTLFIYAGHAPWAHHAIQGMSMQQATCLLDSSKWLTEWLTDWLTDWLTVWLTDWLTDRLTDWLTDRLTDWLTDRQTDWLTDWLTDWQTDSRLTNWPNDKPINHWLTDWLTDLYTELTHCCVVSKDMSSLFFLLDSRWWEICFSFKDIST